MYEIKIDVFEGPLDLLVYLVQKQELNLNQIYITAITDQYLAYLDKMGVQNLSNAGDFLVMASRLMWLKVREMVQEEEEEDLELTFDKQKILQQVIDHQIFKEISKYFQTCESKNIGTFSRGMRERTVKNLEEEIEQNFDTFNLLSTFVQLVHSQKSPIVHEVGIDDVTIEMQLQQLRQFVVNNFIFDLQKYCQKDNRKVFLVTAFLAALEMTKLGELFLRQETNQNIKIYKNNQKIEVPQLTKIDWSTENLIEDLNLFLQDKSKQNLTELDTLIEEIEQEQMENQNLLQMFEKTPLQLLDV